MLRHGRPPLRRVSTLQEPHVETVYEQGFVFQAGTRDAIAGGAAERLRRSSRAVGGIPPEAADRGASLAPENRSSGHRPVPPGPPVRRMDGRLGAMGGAGAGPRGSFTTAG